MEWADRAPFCCCAATPTTGIHKRFTIRYNVVWCPLAPTRTRCAIGSLRYARWDPSKADDAGLAQTAIAMASGLLLDIYIYIFIEIERSYDWSTSKASHVVCWEYQICWKKEVEWFIAVAVSKLLKRSKYNTIYSTTYSSKTYYDIRSAFPSFFWRLNVMRLRGVFLMSGANRMVDFPRIRLKTLSYYRNVILQSMIRTVTKIISW